MTEEYKKGILDYISGNITPESEKNNAFRDNETIQNNLTQKLAEKGITPGNKISILTSENNPNYIMYGYYEKTQYHYYSWIAIISGTGEVLDILTTYESGMPIEMILTLNYDENNNIYGLDAPDGSYYYRIIQLNNMAVPLRNKYVCKLRSSYYIKESGFSPVWSLDNEGTSAIKKIPGEAVYYILGDKKIQPSSADSNFCLIRFSNVVGIPIEWNTYIGENIGDAMVDAADFLINVKNETTTLNIYYYLSTNIGQLKHVVFNGESFSTPQNFDLPNYMTDLKAINKDKVYVACRKRNQDNSYTVECYSINENLINNEFSYTTNEFTQYPSHFIEIIDGIIFSKLISTYSPTPKTKCSVYYNGNLVQSATFEYEDGTLFRTDCKMQKTFNLYNFLIPTTNILYSPSIVVYTNQYSGASRSYYDYTLPSHCEIYSNGYIKYARDLYNRQVYQNQCLSTANVPYNYLNDMELSPTNLISGSMATLESYTTPFEKNKYENLFINYMNKINVIDEDANTIYNSSANYINENINTGNETNYNNTFIGKVMINYSTPVMKNIEWVWNTDHYETSFTIYTNEIPTSIEFMSNDETTSYLTKEIKGLSLNKYYTISQKLRIE